MGPKRSRKGKEIMELNDESESKCPKPIRDERIVFSRNIAGLVSPARDVDNFDSFFKISKKTFVYVRSIVRKRMESKAIETTFLGGQPMSINDKIAISLKRLNSVDSNINIALLFGTDEQSIDDVTRGFVKALSKNGGAHISWPSEMAEIKSGFERIGGMPNCCGAINITHLKMSMSESEFECTCKSEFECSCKVWLDRANNRSMKLQAIVGPTMRFLDVAVGFPGCLTTDKVLHSSEFFNLVQDGERLNGSEMEINVREYIVGGSGFQLLPWLITPYREEDLTEEQNEFNNVHLATRMVAKRALKKLKEVWPVIDGSMWQIGKDQLPIIVHACCILHNIQIDTEGGDGVSDMSRMLFDHDPGYPPEKSVIADKNVEIVRDKLRLYLARIDTE